MNRKHGTVHYSTNLVQDNQEGWVGLELLRRAHGSTDSVARVVFWDAEGQFSINISAPELPLIIVEELIAEAKESIKTG